MLDKIEEPRVITPPENAPLVYSDQAVPLPADVLAARQKWFWRRTTLQVTLAVFAALLFSNFITHAGTELNWPAAFVQVSMVAAMAWLITMYFAMVDSADKIGALADKATALVGQIKDGQ